ncbi:hypothetical protein [Halpernia frigidisoli]|uniref:Uncharacterized protein n=1 Tax=Halpernia frigidisoli TaxID=1125876 RepID=A0A1I3F2L6_9FLAO|nr:hypothetical protein [Halpernia frigidisoli]SFI05403.1 hypothetical protein SAMN05443292_1110 [Halpernia frigidisoli]
MKKTTIYVFLYFLMFFMHFGIWTYLKLDFEVVFFKYYLFLTIIFMMVITILSLFKKIYPDHLGFVFIGLIMVKLMMIMIIKKKLNIVEVPNYKLNFILPYLMSLLLETLYAVQLIKDEKNQ